jgi:hypothetical protein
MGDETQGRTIRTALPVWVARDTRLRTERVPEHIRAVPDVPRRRPYRSRIEGNRCAFATASATSMASRITRPPRRSGMVGSGVLGRAIWDTQTCHPVPSARMS